jgi:Cys-rich repeat protein
MGTECAMGLCKACVGPDGEMTCQACLPGADGMDGCPAGMVCDNDVFVCVECRNDADCSGGEACQFGGCVAV